MKETHRLWHFHVRILSLRQADPDPRTCAAPPQPPVWRTVDTCSLSFLHSKPSPTEAVLQLHKLGKLDQEAQEFRAILSCVESFEASLGYMIWLKPKTNRTQA